MDMRKTIKYICWLIGLLFGVGLYSSLNADFLAYTQALPEISLVDAPEDTVPQTKTRFPVSKTVPEEYEDIVKQSPADLKTPENVKTTIEYDIETGTYVVRTKLGDTDLTTPISGTSVSEAGVITAGSDAGDGEITVTYAGVTPNLTCVANVSVVSAGV